MRKLPKLRNYSNNHNNNNVNHIFYMVSNLEILCAMKQSYEFNTNQG